MLEHSTLRLNDPAYFCEIYVCTFLSDYHLFGRIVILVHKFMTYLTYL